MKIFHQGSYIFQYSMVALETSFYVFGGWKGWPSSVIASFSTATMQGRKLGHLKEARSGHGVIIYQGEFMIVGGYNDFIGPLGTERCILNGDSVQCSTVDPQLEGYHIYPEMMSVSENFCPK